MARTACCAALTAARCISLWAECDSPPLAIQEIPWRCIVTGIEQNGRYEERQRKVGGNRKRGRARKEREQRASERQEYRVRCADAARRRCQNHGHDEADLATKLPIPMLVLWGERSHVNRSYRPIEAWLERALDVRGKMLPCGHYPAEQVPDETYAELQAFFGSGA